MNIAHNVKAREHLVAWFIPLMVLLLQASLNPAFAEAQSPNQSYSVQGLITDQNDEPLPGVNVLIKGTTSATITDVQGKFILRTGIQNPTITISFIGYLKQTVQVGKDGYVLIKMQEDSKKLDDMVVVGYGTKRKGGVSSAVSTISSKEISRSTSTTTAGALVGKIAGITNRQKSGTPGSSSNLQIRNLGTPLYVIDGVIKDAESFNSIDINDIENISVLKDGSAAIYGVKAANGVLLITTKSGGMDQKAQINVNAYTGWQQWTEYPDLLNAYQWQYANYMRDANSGVLAVTSDYAKAELEKWQSAYYNAETGEDYRGYDWYHSYVSSAAPQKYLNGSISGGGETTNYYFSLSQIDQDAVFKDYNYKRTNIQANINVLLTKDLKFGYQNASKIEMKDNPGLPGTDDYNLIKLSLVGLQPIYRPYANENPLYLNYIVGNDARNMAAFTKEYAGRYQDLWRTTQNNFTLDYKTPLKGLAAKGMFTYYYANSNINNNEKGWKEYTYNKATDTYDVRYDKAASGETYLVRTKTNIQDITGQFTLNYDEKIGQDHHLSAVGGFEFYERQYNLLNIEQHPVENSFIDLMSSSENNTVYETKSTYSTASFIFRTSYDYKQKYILDYGCRYDGSWKFPSNNRWGFFPSVSAAWRISEEGFIQNSSISTWLTNLKLRASYGEMGDDALSNYADFAYLPGYNYNEGSASMPVDPTQSSTNSFVSGVQSKTIPNTILSWMTTSMTNIGLEFGFLNNKLTAEIDGFRRMRNGIPAAPNDLIFPMESGIKALPENLNSDEHIGVDGMIKWHDQIGDFKYNIGLNATFSRQKNRRVYGELFFNALDKYYYCSSNRWANVSSGQVWMWETIGTFQTQDEIDNYPVNVDGSNNTTLVPGDKIFKDVNNDGVIDNQDKRPRGYASVDWPWDSSKGNKNPLLSTGLNLGLEWKGIDLAADFSGGFLNTFVPDWYMKWGVSRASNSYAYNSLDVWHHTDIFDPTSPWVAGTFPAIRQYNPSTRGENDFYTRSVNYVRLRNLVLGYTLPKSITGKKLQKLRIFFEGTNLLCWDTLEDYNVDPETSTVNGTDYPQARVISLGANITF